MNTRTTHVFGRSVTALAIGAALTLGSASLAGASSHHDGNRHGDCSSGKVSPFGYAANGAGGLVTAVTPTSVTVQGWNGTTTTYTLTSTTTYSEGKTATTIASLVVGDRVRIAATSADPTTATAVTIELAELVGKVTAVGATSITIVDWQGFTHNINVSSSTVYTSGGAAATLANVTVGSKIFAQGTVDANGTSLDALSVTIGTAGHLESLKGRVSAVTTTSVTVTHGSDVVTFTFTPTTTFNDGTLVLTAANLAVGERVNVQFNSTAATTALAVQIQLATLRGTVTAVGTSTITIQDVQGFNRTINVTSATAYTDNGAASTLASVVVGSKICAVGTIDTDGTSLDALSVIIGKLKTGPVPTLSLNHSNGGNGGNGGHGFGGRHHGRDGGRGH